MHVPVVRVGIRSIGSLFEGLENSTYVIKVIICSTLQSGTCGSYTNGIYVVLCGAGIEIIRRWTCDQRVLNYVVKRSSMCSQLNGSRMRNLNFPGPWELDQRSNMKRRRCLEWKGRKANGSNQGIALNKYRFMWGRILSGGWSEVGTRATATILTTLSEFMAHDDLSA